MNRDPLQERATKLIKPLIPPDSEERVKRAFKQWNQIVRDHIRNETALKLADGEGRQSVQVKVENGFPVSLAELIDGRHDPVLWRLIIGQPRLGGIVDGLNFLLDDWPAFEAWQHLPEVAKNGGDSLTRTRDIVNALQKAALKEKVQEELKKINEDILGAYHFPADRPSSVSLYWMAIAMVAAMIEVRIEDLTVVVLAHELAHGYTHIGRDIDGHQWSDKAFGECDLGIVEGLAQFYTEVVTEKIASRTPGPKQAYERLLKLQGGPYLAHREWLEDNHRDRGEAVRFTMVAVRGQGETAYEEWLKIMNTASTSLRRGTPQKPEQEGLFES